MKTKTKEKNWTQLADILGENFALRSSQHDAEGNFVEQNYVELKEHRFFAALIPEELGGEGVSHALMADIIRTIGQYDGSTALAMSMHQHLLAAAIWKYRQEGVGKEMLEKVAKNQTILVSTGARDWLESNGEVEKVEGGYLVYGVKHFASQSAIGDVMVTSAPYRDPENGWQVLHFSIPMNSGGVQVMNNWDTLGMRGTGSHSIKLDKVFVSESVVALKRSQGEFHPVWNVVLTVAMPLIMSAYVGIAQKAARVALEWASKSTNRKNHTASLIGKMNNELTNAELNWKDMVRLANNFEFDPEDRLGHEILTRKTNVANSVVMVVNQAMEIAGGSGFFRGRGLEQLFRDIQASKYHPLQQADQWQFSGDYLLRA